MEQHIIHRLPISVQRFWKDLFFSPEYTKQVHLQGLGCSSFVVHKPCTGAPYYRRTFYNTPPLNIPSSLQKMVGDNIGYTEEGSFDPDTQRYNFRLVPSVLQKRLSIEGYYYIVEIDAHNLERHCVLQTTAKIFGVGKKVEEVIAQSNIDIQAKTADFSRMWIEKYLS